MEYTGTRTTPKLSDTFDLSDGDIEDLRDLAIKGLFNRWRTKKWADKTRKAHSPHIYGFSRGDNFILVRAIPEDHRQPDTFETYVLTSLPRKYWNKKNVRHYFSVNDF